MSSFVCLFAVKIKKEENFPSISSAFSSSKLSHVYQKILFLFLFLMLLLLLLLLLRI
jgi:hypothetical protein